MAAHQKEINQEDVKALKEYLSQQQPADIVEIIELLSEREEQKKILKLLDAEDMAAVLAELNDGELMAETLLDLPKKQAHKITENLSADDAADILSELSQETQEKLFSLFDDHYAEEVRELMGYDDDTAGGIMTTDYVVVPEFITAEQAIRILRSLSPDAEMIYYIYVIDRMNHLVGILSLRQLIIADSQTPIEKIMWRNVISVNVHDDQEEVANVVSKYDFLAVPVVDDEGKLQGIVTVDDVIDVIHEEATEDIYRLAGTNAAESESDEATLAKFSTAFKSRIPWLIVTIIGGMLSGEVLNVFSVKLNEVIALSFFIPMLIGMGGNVGTQSSTVTVRGIAIGAIHSKTVLSTILREGSIGIALGLVIGTIVAIVAFIWQGSIRLGIVVGSAMLVNMFAAATMGTLVPIFLKKVNIDPAVASAPFITTTIDVMGLVIYATLAGIILGL